MGVGRRGGDAPARGTLQVALLDEVGFDHVFDGVALFANGGGQIVQPHRPAVETVHHRFEQLAVHHVETQRIDVEHAQCGIGHFGADSPRSFHVGIVAHPAQQAVGDARSAAGAAGNLGRAVRVDDRTEQLGRTQHDASQFLGGIKLQPGDDAKAVAQGVGQHARARGGADQSEGLQVDFHTARARPFADQDVDLIILQRRIQNLLDHRRKAVDLVDEQHVVALQIGQQRSQIARAFEHRAGGRTQVHAHFPRHDVRQRGLAQTRRAEQQHVVEGFFALARRADENVELLTHPDLADVVVELLRAQRTLGHGLLRRHGRSIDHPRGAGSKGIRLYGHGRRREELEIRTA